MVYEVRCRLKHGCSDTAFSELFGKRIMYAYCSRKYDYKLIPGNPTDEVLAEAEKLYTNFDTWEITNYNQKNGNCMVRMECTCFMDDTSLMKNLQNAGGMPVYPIRYEQGWEYHKIICFNAFDLQNVMSFLNSLPVFELISISDKGDDIMLSQALFTSEIFYDLTANQKNILTKAFEMGYYNIPRELKLSELANEIGVSRYAIEKSLRTAENKIMKMVMPFMYLEGEKEQDELEQKEFVFAD